MSPDNILEVQRLTVEFEDGIALSDVSFNLKQAETLAVIGPNGAGKSVLFRALLGLIPYQGKISWRPAIKIGYVPQKFYIERGFPLSVGEFLTLKNSRDKIEESLKLTGLSDPGFADMQLGNLSGGELQRVLIAWAIAGNPDVLLLDEPLAGIDIGGEETIYSLIHHISKTNKTTIVMISHDLGVVYRYADQVLCINQKQICLGTPNEVITDESARKLYGEAATVHVHYGAHHEEDIK